MHVCVSDKMVNDTHKLQRWSVHVSYTNHSSESVTRRTSTHKRLSDAGSPCVCVGPCMHIRRLPQPCVWHACVRATRWRMTLTSCSVGQCTCHAPTTAATSVARRTSTSKRLSDAGSPCVYVGPCMYLLRLSQPCVWHASMCAGDKMANDTHKLQH